MEKESIEVSESRAKGYLLQDLTGIDLDKIPYENLAELKIAILKLDSKIGRIYRQSFFSDAYEPNEEMMVFDDKTKEEIDNYTRKFARENISYFKSLVESCNSIEEFASQLDEEPYNDEIEENNYEGTIGLYLDFALLVDEITALKANTMLFKGKSKKEVVDFVAQNNTMPYVNLLFGVNVSFGTGQQYYDGSNIHLLSSLPNYSERSSAVVNLYTLCDELNKLGFELNYIRYGAKTPKEIISALAYSNEDNIGLFDTSLEISDDKALMVFPKQKVK